MVLERLSFTLLQAEEVWTVVTNGNSKKKLIKRFIVPSYVGSSFSFIGVVVSATGYNYMPGSELNERIDVAAGGILVCGLALGAIGLLVMFVGYNWIEEIMPPGNTIEYLLPLQSFCI